MTLNEQLHNSASHLPGYDPACPVCIDRQKRYEDATEGLRLHYERWVKSQGFGLADAHELLADPKVNSEQATWLYAFITLWDAAVASAQEAKQP
jgi:hypothetical protein